MTTALVMPLHDPQGILFPHLFVILDRLKALFDRAFVSVPPATRSRYPQWVDTLLADNFFDLLLPPVALPAGDEFVALYRHAATTAPPGMILQLCFLDRVAFALQSRHQLAFQADMQALTAVQTPLIFQRSAAAWRTHPRNYRQLEQILTTTGQLLFGKSLDFAWCHVAVQAGTLQAILPQIQRHDLAVCAELVLLLRETMQTRAVDWLAWEDPLILGRPARQLKREREQSAAEARKRLAYVLPMLQALQAAAARDDK